MARSIHKSQPRATLKINKDTLSILNTYGAVLWVL